MAHKFVTPIQAMSESQKEWFATAIVSMVLADNSITKAEVQTLLESLSFLGDPAAVERLKKFVHFQTPPPLAIFRGWEKQPRYRAAMLLDLMQVAISDRDLSEKEKQQFYAIGKLLAFPADKIDALLAHGAKSIETMTE
ncbi:MAG: TerB family tellurite resistance protein [Candidatus Lambdaproteobacteria bacterium]|nr:TerB family tellurite resistance protein [Candidatus Lambdaproteobacteria bacterium]